MFIIMASIEIAVDNIKIDGKSRTFSGFGTHQENNSQFPP